MEDEENINNIDNNDNQNSILIEDPNINIEEANLEAELDEFDYLYEPIILNEPGKIFFL